MQLQAIPRGFLSLLGVKAGGNPNQAAEFVQPVLPIEHLYVSDLLNSAQATLVGATNPGDLAVLTVPGGEAWRLVAAGLFATAFSATPVTLRCSMAMFEPQGAIFTPIMNPPFVQTISAAGEFVQTGVLFPQPFLLPPGGQLSATLESDLGVITCTLGIRALFHRLVV